jgi:hypothetical protein
MALRSWVRETIVFSAWPSFQAPLFERTDKAAFARYPPSVNMDKKPVTVNTARVAGYLFEYGHTVVVITRARISQQLICPNMDYTASNFNVKKSHPSAEMIRQLVNASHIKTMAVGDIR